MATRTGIGLFALAAFAATANAQLFGVGNFGNFSTQTLYSIDVASGAATPIGSTGLNQIADIAYVGSTNTMYALTVNADLYTLNLSTGAASLVASVNNTIPEGALTRNQITGRMFTSSSDILGEISLTSAVVSDIGFTNVDDNDISGLAFFDSTLFAYATNGDNADSLLSIDTATGQATRIGFTGVQSAAFVGGLAKDLGRVLFLSDGDALFSVDVTTGQAARIGAHGVAGMSGIAFVPAPAGAAAFIIAGLAASRRRR
jgi:hypothetical protein